jgi:hypothetical protein
MAPNFSKEQIEKLVKEPILGFTINKGSNVGDNVAGELYAIKVEATSGKSYNLVIKTLPEEESAFREYMRASRVFVLEMAVYTTLKESLENLIKIKGLDITLPLPPYFGGQCDGENDFLCLEDQRPLGFRMPDKYAGLNFVETKVILEELGRFHALTYSLIKFEGEKFFTGTEGREKMIRSVWDDPNLEEMANAMFSGAVDNAVDIIRLRDEELSRKMRAALDSSKIYKIMMSVGKMTDEKIFPVIIHGDFWVNNILIKYNDRDEPTSVKFIDFQQTRRGNIFEELLYFIFTSTTPDLRAKHLSQLLQVYYESFTSSLDLLKTPRPYNFTLGTFLDMFYDGYLHAYIYTAFAIPLQLGNLAATGGNPEDDKSLMSSTRLRVLMEGSPRAIDRLEAITREFVQLKIFV